MLLKLAPILLWKPWYLRVAGKTPIIAYAPKGAASYNDSLINLANPGTNNAAAGEAPTWNASDGWIFDDDSNYLTTGNVTITDNFTIVIRYSNLTILSSLISGFDGSNDILDFGFYDDNIYGSLDDMWTETVFVEPVAPIVVALNKNGIFLNGSLLIAPDAPPSTFSSVVPLSIGAYRPGTGSERYSAVFEQAIAIYDTTLTANEISIISAVMAGL